MKLSIITVCYNAAETIADTIKSVAAQDWPDIEHIIVDGASSDDTLAIVAQHANTFLKVITEPDNGLYDAMNKGVAAASGDVIAFLNADDFYCRSDALTLIAKAFEKSAYPAVAAAIALVHKDAIKKPVRAYRARNFKPWMLYFGHMLPHPGFFVRRETFLNVGPFSIDYRIGGDFDWMVRYFLKNGLAVQTLKETLVGLRLGGISTAGLASHAKINQEAFAILRRNGKSAFMALMWVKYAAKWLQWVLPAYAYPPPNNVSILPMHET